MLNAGADFTMPEEDSLVNRGIGRNYGIELTLEKFYSNGYYFLVTTSVFDSKYKGSDNVLRNTTFNSRYVVNLLAGKEFKVGRKNNVFNIDWKLTSAGGRYVTPIHFEKSRMAGEAVYRQEEAFSSQLGDYFRTDLKFSFRMNRKKATHEFSLDLQNLTNQQNVFAQRYNARTNQIATEYQIGFFPIPQYRLLF
jgi:outer membrane receptor protein involved in Fe transport